jgi:hypothetical protein
MSSPVQTKNVQHHLHEALLTLVRDLPEHHIVVLACPVGGRSGNAAFTNPKTAIVALADQFVKVNAQRLASTSLRNPRLQ